MTNETTFVPRVPGVMVGVAIVLAITYGSLMHNPPSLDVEQGDKWQHLAGYISLAGWWGLVLPQRKWLAALGAALFGVLIECLQGMTDYRSFDVLDMAANATGAVLGALLATALLWLWRWQLRRRCG